MNLFKKIFIPTNEKQELLAYESWVVKWDARYDGYSGCYKPVAEVFTNEQDAKEFANALKEAFKLVQNTHDVKSITITKN